MEATHLQSIRRDGTKESIWQTAEKQSITINSSLTGKDIFDVIIIGGGITGITTALNLQREGKKCLLIEAKNLGFGTTGGTSAHLNTFFDATYPEIDSDFGKDASKLIAAAGKRVILAIKGNIDSLGIDADFSFRDGYLFSQDEKETKQLKEILASSVEAGTEVEGADTNGVGIAFDYSVKFSNQAQFHPLKYINGLARAFEALGGQILENTFVSDTKFLDGIHQVKAADKSFSARNIVWATHIPPGINILSLRNAPYRSYVLAVQLSDGNYPACLSYDMKEPYHYFRTHEIEDQKYLLVGGEDHKTGHDDPEQAFAALETYVRQNFAVDSISYKWSSQYYVPVDGLPYIGKLPGAEENIYVATGFNGNGMIFGTLSAEILTDLILNRQNELSELLSPSRLKPVAGFTEFVKENADVAYHFVADRFNNEALETLDKLPKNEGQIAKFDGEQLAIYKDGDGKISALSPVCTHAGCIISWNTTEKSWDCPCHGGRFSVDGAVLTGPPRAALKKVNLTKNS